MENPLKKIKKVAVGAAILGATLGHTEQVQAQSRYNLDLKKKPKIENKTKEEVGKSKNNSIETSGASDTREIESLTLEEEIENSRQERIETLQNIIESQKQKIHDNEDPMSFAIEFRSKLQL